MEKLKYEDLEMVINKYKTEESKISIKVKDFNENIIVEHNPNIKVNSASCIKVAIMIAVLNKVQMSELELDKVIDFRNLDLDDEDGIYNEIERKATVLELLTFMIINSDNLATDALIELFGFEYYNNFFKEIGLLNTELNRLMGIYDSGKENYTSNEDMYRLYKLIFQDGIIDKELGCIAKRYEKSSTIITTNQQFSKWGEIFSDNILANAILDRLLHHSYVFNITGDSYRLKDILNKMENFDNSM